MNIIGMSSKCWQSQNLISHQLVCLLCCHITLHHLNYKIGVACYSEICAMNCLNMKELQATICCFNIRLRSRSYSIEKSTITEKVFKLNTIQKIK